MADDTAIAKPKPADETSSAAELTALNLELFGEDAVIGDDGVPFERGAGSKYALLLPEQRAHFSALVALVAAERAASDAAAAVVTADQRVVEARAAVDAAKVTADAAAAKKAEREAAKAKAA